MKAFAANTLVMVAALLVGISCTKSGQSQEPLTGQTSKQLNVAIWANYFSPEMQEKFTKETGIKLNVSNYSSNEELLAKVQAGASGYDIAVPSDYMVEIMIKQDMLLPLDAVKIPNKGNISPEFLGLEFDKANAYSLPYIWATAGIAVNTEVFSGKMTSWKDLFENKDLAGKISLLDDVREVMAMALKKNGQSLNATDEAVLKKAQADLKELRPRIKMFRSDVIDLLVNKEVAVSHAFSTDALQAEAKSGGKVRFVIPDEGASRYLDTLVILKNAKNVEAAHALINFLMTPEANVALVKAIRGGAVLKQTRELLPADLKNNPTLFPSQDSLRKFERIHDVGPATTIYDRLWTELKIE